MALRWGIVSTGRISHDFVVCLNGLPETEHIAVSVAARSLKPATEFAQSLNIPTAYGSYEELAKDPQVDVVYIGNVSVFHKDTVLMMFDNGKHVLCEKPLTSSPEDTAILIRTAREKGLFLMEGVWTRCFPAINEMHKQIAMGTIGEVKYVHATIGAQVPSKLMDHMRDPKMKEGSVLRLGVYPINFATMVFGEKPESIDAKGWLTDTGVDEFAAITLKYSGERIAQLSCSFNLKLPVEAHVVGTKGILKIPQRFMCPLKLETPSGVLEFPLPKPSGPTIYPDAHCMCYEAEEVKKCIAQGRIESEAMPLEHTQIVSEVMKTILEQLGACI